MRLLYFFIAIASTTIGSLTGMGGGIIIKPVLDMLGDFDVETINMLSCITVFSMSLVSIIKQVRSRTKISISTALLLAAGSVAGGNIGQKLLSGIVAEASHQAMVTVIQNSILSALIILIFIYMLFKSRMPSYHFKGAVSCLLTGFALGVVSSFLGIGGGPVNVAVFIFLFSFDTKKAALYSLFTILFAQASKLVAVAASTGFAAFDFSILPYMVTGAIWGGFAGASLNKRLNEKQVESCFNAVQVLVLGICIFNIVRNIVV